MFVSRTRREQVFGAGPVARSSVPGGTHNRLPATVGTFPGCGRAHYIDAHHIRHWADGGDTSLENTTLLCTHHHTLLHEGGFTIQRDEGGGIYFRRPDGRVIPRAGYRSEDMVDDGIGADGAELDRASAEARMFAIVHGLSYDERDNADPSAEGWLHGNGAENPSAEVREAAGVYRIRKRAVQYFDVLNRT